jgi:predicted  nucleic acid-binding Zn-ribbon protein
MKRDEFEIIFGNINEKFDTLIERHHSLKEQLDRNRVENKKEHEGLTTEILDIKKDIYNIRQDVNEHRNNTELHAVRKKKKAF